MSDLRKEIWDCLKSVHGCKKSGEDCCFKKCSSWAECDLLSAALAELFEQRIDPLRKVYEENKELSKTFKLPIVIEFWQAIKSVVEGGEK